MLVRRICLTAIALVGLPLAAAAQENYESWPVLKPTFPSTGGNGITIKGYDPVLTGGNASQHSWR
jgi:hypothetical protein